MIEFKLRDIMLFLLLYSGISMAQVNTRPLDYKPKDIIWNERLHLINSDKLTPGLAVYWENKINYKRNGNTIFDIHFKEPVKVYEAKKEQSWGFVQFPKIFKVLDDRIAITWSMNPDDIRAQNKYGWKYSRDEGQNWNFKWSDRPSILGHKLSNGDYLKIISLFPKTDTMQLPIPYYISEIKGNKNWKFYEVDKVNKNYLGFFQNRTLNGTNEIIREKAEKVNSTALVYEQNGVFPQQAWGDIKATKDGSLIKCIYPSFYKDSNGGVQPSGIDFYCSTNGGKSWNYQGTIHYKFHPPSKEKRILGYSEPTFEILENGNLICVLRSSPGYQTGPMLISTSSDLGKTWSTPVKVANNGVLPQLQRLNNGVKVLSSGRPGVQLRFSNDALGSEWSEPFEMIRYHGLKGQVSCGYSGILPISDNSFLLVYANFRNRDKANNLRKAIFVREVVVDNYK